MVEYPIGVQPLDTALQTIEVDTFKRWLVQVEAIGRAELEVAACFPVVKVDTEFGTIDVEGHLFFLGLVLVVAEEVFHIECISQKYPSPTEIDAQFGT